MLRQLSFLGITIFAIMCLYNFHTLATYLYYNYCCGLATGTPPCLYLLELMYISVNGVKSFWVYLGTLAAGLFLYAFNRSFSEWPLPPYFCRNAAQAFNFLGGMIYYFQDFFKKSTFSVPHRFWKK